MSLQIVLIRIKNNLYFGELADGHIFKGKLYDIKAEKLKDAPISDDWKSYATNRVFKIESPNGWTKSAVINVPKFIVTETG